ncbi:MAG: hypothetical protein APF84_12500 [Gracilibacter sp. BRH_c7a]|nr:MAG: hypothetical protein APF84_12500 [Gracilibacter sp. BRH_c7a]
MDQLMTPDILLGAFLLSQGIECQSTKIYDNQTYYVFNFGQQEQKAFEKYHTNQMLKELKKNYDELNEMVIRYSPAVEEECYDEY